MSETRKPWPTIPPIRINFDPEPLKAVMATFAKDMQRANATLMARAVFGMAYKGNEESARASFTALSPEERAKVADAARMLARMYEETPAPINLMDPQTWV